MSAISKVENLKDAHLQFILSCLSRSSDFVQIKQNFQDFFETGISGEILIEVAEKHKEKVIELKEKVPFEDRAKNVPLADPLVQIKLLDEIRKDCLKPRVVNVTREGVQIEKVDHPTAARCVEVAARISQNEKERELKLRALELARENSGGGGGTHLITDVTASSGPQVRIIHKKEKVEDASEEE